MMPMRERRAMPFLCATTLLACACGSSAPTQQLVDARTAYQQAAKSPASKYKQDELYTARQALTHAEEAHNNEPGSEAEAHLAYLAERKAQIAAMDGEGAQAKSAAAKAEEDYNKEMQLKASGNSAELTRMQQELSSERAARTTAEAQAAGALASLEQVGKVNQDQRGTVVSLSGGVLFDSGKAKVSKKSEPSLNQVASVLQAQPPDKHITVEGYTDSQGNEASNLHLSQQRADSVRSYLVTHGVPSSRIKAIGRGEADPIADNDTAEGRADNRRVEIVIGAGDQPLEVQVPE